MVAKIKLSIYVTSEYPHTRCFNYMDIPKRFVGSLLMEMNYNWLQEAMIIGFSFGS